MVAIVFVHGILERKEQFNDFIAQCHNDYKCYNITLPGHDKDVLDFGKHGAKEWKEYLWRYLLYVKSKHKIVYAVGHSLGGLLLINLLHEHKGLVDKLVCLALPLKIHPKYKGLVDAFRVGFKLYNQNNKRLVIKRDLYAFSYCRNIFKYYRWPIRYLELFSLSFKARNNIKNVMIPILVINSVNDEMVSANIKKYLPENVKYLMLKLSGHATYDQSERKELLLSCLDFFGSLNKTMYFTIKYIVFLCLDLLLI